MSTTTLIEPAKAPSTIDRPLGVDFNAGRSTRAADNAAEIMSKLPEGQVERIIAAMDRNDYASLSSLEQGLVAIFAGLGIITAARTLQGRHPAA